MARSTGEPPRKKQNKSVEQAAAEVLAVLHKRDAANKATRDAAKKAEQQERKQKRDAAKKAEQQDGAAKTPKKVKGETRQQDGAVKTPKKVKGQKTAKKDTIKAELEFSVDEMRLDNEKSRSHYLFRTGLIGAPRGQGSRVFPYDMSKRDSVKAAKQRAVAEALRICKERGVTTKPKFVQ